MKGKIAGAVASLFLLCVMDVSAATGSIKVDVPNKYLDQITCVKVGTMKQGEFYLEDVYQKSDVDLNAIKNARQLESAAKELMRFAEEDKGNLIVLNRESTFSDLEEGVYLIYSYEENMMPTLVFVPTWDEIEKNMNYEIEIKPKFASQKHSPQTGWESGAVIYLSMIMVSFAVIIWIGKRRWIRYS